eukprot:m.38816 g.38816  ORF g.38816 m.38816 type:complete len:100 (+) comp12620_c0_seq2:526-825(+)
MAGSQTLRQQALALYRGLHRKINVIQHGPQRLYYKNMLKDEFVQHSDIIDSERLSEVAARAHSDIDWIVKQCELQAPKVDEPPQSERLASWPSFGKPSN